MLERIEAKLDQILRLAALQITGNMKGVSAIRLLGAAGFDRQLIADLLGTTPNTVSVTMSNSRKARKKHAQKTDPGEES